MFILRGEVIWTLLLYSFRLKSSAHLLHFYGTASVFSPFFDAMLQARWETFLHVWARSNGAVNDSRCSHLQCVFDDCARKISACMEGQFSPMKFTMCPQNTSFQTWNVTKSKLIIFNLFSRAQFLSSHLSCHQRSQDTPLRTWNITQPKSLKCNLTQVN